MEESSSKNVLSGFASYLAQNPLLDKQAVITALQQASKNQTSYIEYLVKQSLLPEMDVVRAASEYFGLPLCDASAFNRELIPHEYLNIQLVKNRQALPLFKKNGLLYIAITDPTVENLYELRFLTGLDIRLFMVEPSKLSLIFDDVLNTMIFSEMDELSSEGIDHVTVHAYEEENIDLGAYDVESAPVVNYVNKVLLDAIDKGASDIHFERYEDSYRIRFRQHGVLIPISSPPTKMANYLLARVKVISNLDITEHRLPQDGRFKLFLSKKRAVDFRVSVCPTLFGEKVVLRILDPTKVFHNVKLLGMNALQLNHFENALQRSQGMILVTGPTGSGKTVTLYSALHYLNSVEKNISTVEDPVEIPIKGINQVPINPKAGLMFANVLRAFLRQDPDIIMVGEIRDLETGEIAIKAAQTGHLVLSTLHTNSAPETVTRLMSMGIATYNLATSLSIVIAQRLVRVLCEKCKKVEEFSEEALLTEGFNKEDIGQFVLYTAVGCDHCARGFKGRIAIFEVMPVTTEISQLIMEGGNTLDILNQARKDKIISLRESGLEKVKQGITSLAELNRVFK